MVKKAAINAALRATKPRLAGTKVGNGAPGRIRTSGPQIRSLVLYPAELRARGKGRHRGWAMGAQPRLRGAPGRPCTGEGRCLDRRRPVLPGSEAAHREERCMRASPAS